VIDEPAFTELLARLVAVRRDLHRHPELGFEEHRTQEVVLEFLRSWGYAPRPCAGTGVVADLRPGQPGGVGIRADMDALPIHEQTPLDYASVREGVAHKCGHDGHTAIGLGTAAWLAMHKDEVPHNVRFLFQPAEEGVRGGGAKVMLAEGALDGLDAVYGLHNWPGFPKGEVRVAPGPVMAAVTNLRFTVVGVGGHGSQPHRCRDPIVGAAHLVTALQTVVSRGVGADGGAVVSIGSIHGGKANNVIPREVVLLGTVRTFADTIEARVLERVREVADGVGRALGLRVELEVQREYPVLVNDAACADRVAQCAVEVVGPERVSAAELPITASEDFAFFGRALPAAYFFLGAGDPVGDTPGCHHPDFDFDDDLIPIGIGVFTRLAGLRRGTAPQPSSKQP